MCGVAGAFAFGSRAEPINRDIILRLNDLQRRRGPDGAGSWSSDDDRVVLGHRRLAIIDTGSSGAQPMSDTTGRWVISFNGEIYNYRALRQELERLGRVFHSSSDTEVLINAVAQWGEAALRKLRGMYAFALWDSLERELWLARDPYGIKPLYVAANDETVWFASQARAACALWAGGYETGCCRAYRLLSVGARARTIFLVGRHPHVSCRSCAAHPSRAWSSQPSSFRPRPRQLHEPGR